VVVVDVVDVVVVDVVVDEVVVVDGGRVVDVVVDDGGRVVDVELELVEVLDTDVDVVFAGESSPESRSAKMISTAATATISTASAHSNGLRAGLSDDDTSGVGGGTAACGWVDGSVLEAGSSWPGTVGMAWVGSSDPVGPEGSIGSIGPSGPVPPCGVSVT
jgi:hypothetical protein